MHHDRASRASIKPIRAEVVALACSAPPGGRKRWTVRLLTAAAQQRPGLVGVNRETIRQMLKKTPVNPGAS